MRFFTLILAALLAATPLTPRPAAAADLALVLLTDVSGSMDGAEYAMVKDGYRAAFADPQVLAAIAANVGGIAVTYVEFSDASNFRIVRGWSLLTDGTSARAFGDAVAAAPRSSTGNTALAASLQPGHQRCCSRRISAMRARSSTWPATIPGMGAAQARCATAPLRPASPSMRCRSSRSFSTVASMARPTRRPSSSRASGMAAFYRQYVIGGPGSFLIEANDFSAFGEALKRKLLRELIAGEDMQEASARP